MPDGLNRNALHAPDRVLDVKPVKKGNYVTLHELTYTDHAGMPHVREFASRRGTGHMPDRLTPGNLGSFADGVTVVAFTPGRKRLLITLEFRPAANGFVLGLPSGFIDPGETPEQAALRELHEETGADRADVLTVMRPGFSNPSLSDTASHVVLCEVPDDIGLKSRFTPHEHIVPELCGPDELRLRLKDTPATTMLQAVGLLWDGR